MRGSLVVVVAVLVGCSDSSGPPDASQGIDVILAEPQIHVTGTVTDGVNGTPIAGASVALYHAGGALVTGDGATTDAQGNFSLSVETGGYAPFGYVRAVKSGYLDTFYWPGPLTADVSGMKVVVLTNVQRDAIYANAGISSDPSKLFVRVSVTDGASPIEGATVTSNLPPQLPGLTDATGVGYVLNAPTYLDVRASKAGKTAKTLKLEAYEQGGKLVMTSLVLD